MEFIGTTNDEFAYFADILSVEQCITHIDCKSARAVVVGNRISIDKKRLWHIPNSG